MHHGMHHAMHPVHVMQARSARRATGLLCNAVMHHGMHHVTHHTMAYYGVQAAVDKEREACHRRLSEMSTHYEEQMHAQRLRATGQARGESG